MRSRNRFSPLAILLALGLSGCSGGGSGTAPSAPGAPQQPSQPGTETATQTYTLGSAASSYAFPPLSGFSGSVAMPAATVPAGTTLQLTSALQLPAGAPTLQDMHRFAQAAGTLNLYFITTIRLSGTITFQSLPGFSLTLPGTINPAGQQFFYAVSTSTPNSGAVLSFGTQGPATVAGQTVTFAPSNTPLTLLARKPYIVAFYAISAIAATPTPTFTGKIYVANSGYNSLTTYTAEGERTSPTIPTGSGSYPDGVAVDAAGKIYIANFGGNTVTTYTVNGAPTTPTITGLNGPAFVAVDAAGKIYVTNVANITNGKVTTYNPDGTPTTPTITGLNDPQGIAVDPAGKIYVTSYFAGTLTTYTQNGTQTTPIISGLGGPLGVAVH